ncbi:MAG: AAA family ATPase, partial [Chitinophagaceae bacterium]|nr:AAA family ATPase [Chitinophagaceae bacterium]
MKFYRKAIEKLSEWQNKPNRKPLVLRGARQVGKSTLVRQFSKRFDYYIELNLERKEDASFFNEFKNVLQLVEAACLSKNIPFAPTKTLLFIDEIQQVSEAIAMLRYFYEDLPDLHIIAAGSLLEFAMGDVSAMPVGRIELLKLHPMDFEEFLLACDEQKALLYWKEVPMKDLALNKLMGLFNRYLIVGGMPAVVEQYVTNGQMLNGLGEAYASIWDV